MIPKANHNLIQSNPNPNQMKSELSFTSPDTIFTQHDMIMLCNSLTEKLGKEHGCVFQPLERCEGGIDYVYHDKSRDLKSLRIYSRDTRRREKFPWVRDNVMSDWINGTKIIFLPKFKALFYLKGDKFNVKEIRMIKTCLVEHGFSIRGMKKLAKKVEEEYEDEDIEPTSEFSMVFKGPDTGFSKHDMIMLCNSLTEKLGKEHGCVFQPLKRAEGGIEYVYHDKSMPYKSIKIGSNDLVNKYHMWFPRVSDNVMTEWINSKEVIFPPKLSGQFHIDWSGDKPRPFEVREINMIKECLVDHGFHMKQLDLMSNN